MAAISLSGGRWDRPVAAVVVFLSSAPLAVATPINPSEVLHTLVFDPRWGTFTNFTVLFLMVLGLVIVPLRQKLERGGVAVAVALSLVFAASLTLTGNFHLLDLGPVAGIGLFTILGAVAGLVFQRLFNLSAVTMAALAYVIGFGSMQLAAPGLLPVAEQWLVAPAFIYAAAIAWMIYAFVTQVFPSKPANSWMAHAARTLSARSPQARQRVQEETQTSNALSDVTAQETSDHAVVLSELDETQRVLKRNAWNPELRTALSARLVQLSQAQRKVEGNMGRFRALVERVEFLDLAECSDLQQTLESLPGEVQAEARLELHDLRKKLGTDEVLKRLGQAVTSNNIFVTDALERAKKALAAGQVKACQDALNSARSGEAEALRIDAQIGRFAGQLRGAAAKVIAGAETRAGETALAR